LIERLGYGDAPVDTAYSWNLNDQYLQWARLQQPGPDSWPALSTGRTNTAIFWYRTSPAALIPSYNNAQPTQNDPPFTLSHMRLVRLDPSGRLVEFQAIPPQVESGDESAVTSNAGPLFDAAALPLASFHEVEPRWTPGGYADVRRAWEGPLPDVSRVTARVEAAWYRGKPTFFSVLPPWTVPGRMVGPSTNAVGQWMANLVAIIEVALIVLSVILARRHLPTGRADRRGAFRTAAVLFVLAAAGFVLRTRVFSSLYVESDRLALLLAISLYSASVVWLFYIALEPYVRRFWPQLLIGWTRLISGGVRDPLVGREILVGVAAGTIGAFLIDARQLVPYLLGLRAPLTDMTGALLLLGARHVIGVGMQTVRQALGVAIQVVGVVVFLRILFKRTWLVLLLSGVILLPIAMNGTFAREHLAFELLISGLGIVVGMTVLLRFGLLAVVVMFYTFLLIEAFPLTVDFSRPYIGISMGLIVAIAGLSIFGFVASRGDEPLFGRALLD
jgi:hypothetical protein